MKGLRKYLKKYGPHFTEKLASKVVYKRWSMKDIINTSNRKVYYNVTDSTDGDMFFLVNYFGTRFNKIDAVNLMLTLVGDYYSTGIAFMYWCSINEDFDLTAYI
jgi:hypothetical protein